MEPQAKVLLSRGFLATTHGALACETCHGGNPASLDKAKAHAGFEPMPSSRDPAKACGECHGEIASTARDSLHATLATFPRVLGARTGSGCTGQVEEGRRNHCSACHTSCGGCHVSRPAFAGKGFVDGHVFRKRPDPINQCTACHGSRVGSEFYGERGQGDVHAARGMDCASCHPAAEMHAAAPPGLPGRYQLPEMPRCTGCHADLEHGSVREHGLHAGKVQCQVCHSQTYVNCSGCHVGKDAEGTAYFQNRREVETLKIGLQADPDAGYRYGLVRHVPAYPEMFDHYGKDLFPDFAAVPTWKRASPHNVQRRTWQAATCNNCHGNRALFLSAGELDATEREANRKVVVPDGKVPGPIEKIRKVQVDVSGVRAGMVVSPPWLEENLAAGKVVVVDARTASAYAKGHIPGAISLDPLKAGFRTGADADRPFGLKEHAEVAAILGRAGISADDHVVVYDQNGLMALALAAVLEWAGIERVSYLDGGIEGWHDAGRRTRTEPSTRPARDFRGKARTSFVVDGRGLADVLGKPGVVLLDARAIHRILGETRHEKAARSGAIPGSVNLPLGALLMDNGALKSPRELLWMLRSRGITPDRTVITTCDTGLGAADAFFLLRWLGFRDVRVHEEAWVGWSRTH
ncbi:MAG: rhodanese-like domain-containing protein [Anaeromyxobacteraceae bacterium]